MSWQLAAHEPYVTRFETEVTAVDGRRVWLETSYFFAESGGQPTDQGTIADVPVESVELEDGVPVHVLATEPTIRAGHRVMCRVDWDFRMYCMRAHTAGHVLVGAARRLCDRPLSGRVQIGSDRVAVDLSTRGEIGDAVVQLDRLVNDVVWNSLPVNWTDLEAATARERPGIAFPDTTESTAVEAGRVRVVSIGAADADPGTGADDRWDVTACGGTHVRNTREIGPVTVLERSRPSRETIRIRFAVGPPAIERRAAEKRFVADAARERGVSVSDLLSR